MQWQDWVIGIGSWVFVISLIPTIRAKEKPQLITSITTGTILMIFAITQLTLKLWFASISTTAISICWLILAYQKYRQQK